MNCSKHPDKEAVGVCVYCGKFFCSDCLIEVKGKMYCRDCVSKAFDEVKEKDKPNNPIVFMNAGGASSSSASSSASTSSSGGTGNGYINHVIPLKSKMVAGLLGIFLGGFGLHKFYLEKAGQGVLYLLFCWTFIPSIIGLIEGISYLVMSDYEFGIKYGGRPI